MERKTRFRKQEGENGQEMGLSSKALSPTPSDLLPPERLRLLKGSPFQTAPPPRDQGSGHRNPWRTNHTQTTALCKFKLNLTENV